jgi:uncharacterized protein DUF6969
MMVKPMEKPLDNEISIELELSELRQYLRDLARSELARMNDAADEIIECYRVLNKTDANVVGEVIKGYETFYEWDHYPEGDVYDNETHSQYYYHSHRESEHGHFHTFLRRKGMDDSMQPVAYDGEEEWPTGDEELSHLVGLSMNPQGFPVGMFTTNRWVTDENWFVKEDVIGMIDKFNIDHSYPSWPVNRWLTAMVILFKPQIIRLVERRDAEIARWRDLHPNVDVYEDRGLELTSEIKISVEDQMRAVKEVKEGRTD